jgi:hypothetical protein
MSAQISARCHHVTFTSIDPFKYIWHTNKQGERGVACDRYTLLRQATIRPLHQYNDFINTIFALCCGVRICYIVVVLEQSFTLRNICTYTVKIKFMHVVIAYNMW